MNFPFKSRKEPSEYNSKLKNLLRENSETVEPQSSLRRRRISLKVFALDEA